MCQMSWNLGSWTSCYPEGLSRAVIGLLYLYLYLAEEWTGKGKAVYSHRVVKWFFAVRTNACMIRFTDSHHRHHHHWHNSPLSTKTLLRNFCHLSLLLAAFLQCLSPNFMTSPVTPSSHLRYGKNKTFHEPILRSLVRFACRLLTASNKNEVENMLYSTTGSNTIYAIFELISTCTVNVPH
jgi:hypothetical protein